MKTLADLTARVADLEARLQNIKQIAKVTAVHADANLVDVEVRGVALTRIPCMTHRAGEKGKTYWLPEIGELGLLQSPGGDLGNAIFQPGLNYDMIPAPESDANIMLRVLDDGVKEEWNGNNDIHLLSVGTGAERKTEKTGKIEDKTGTARLALEAGSAKLEATTTAKISISSTGLTIELSPAVKIALGPTGVTITAPTTNVLGVFQVGGVPLLVP